MKYADICSENRKQINDFLQEYWMSTNMVIRGVVVDMTNVEGIAVFEEDCIKGLITYLIDGRTCEILSLNSLDERRGIGSELLKRVEITARRAKCKKIIVITTNDNIYAMQFYQKRGFDMVKLYHNIIEESRKLKPQIPIMGENNIMVRHEIEFELPIR